MVSLGGLVNCQISSLAREGVGDGRFGVTVCRQRDIRY
jgi:hypothetical protein